MILLEIRRLQVSEKLWEKREFWPNFRLLEKISENQIKTRKQGESLHKGYALYSAEAVPGAISFAKLKKFGKYFNFSRCFDGENQEVDILLDFSTNIKPKIFSSWGGKKCPVRKIYAQRLGLFEGKFQMLTHQLQKRNMWKKTYASLCVMLAKNKRNVTNEGCTLSRVCCKCRRFVAKICCAIFERNTAKSYRFLTLIAVICLEKKCSFPILNCFSTR